MESNRCPFCGWDGVEIVGSPYAGIGRGRCPNCQSNGPEVSPPSAAVGAFTHPACLMKAKVLVKRETAQECLYRLEAVGLKYGGSPDGLAAFADLTTALEVK